MTRNPSGPADAAGPMSGSRLPAAGNPTLAPELQRKILKERAVALALEEVPVAARGECLEIVEFLLAGERYGIESSYVSEVHAVKDFTPLPCTPPFVLGIMGVQGRILSVLDLRRFFDLPGQGLTDLNRVIIVHDTHMEFGILADAILHVRMIPLAALEPSLPTLTEVRADYLKGVTKERLAVLDGEKLLSCHRLVVHEEV